MIPKDTTVEVLREMYINGTESVEHVLRFLNELLKEKKYNNENMPDEIRAFFKELTGFDARRTPQPDVFDEEEFRRVSASCSLKQLLNCLHIIKLPLKRGILMEALDDKFSGQSDLVSIRIRGDNIIQVVMKTKNQAIIMHTIGKFKAFVDELEEDLKQFK